MRGHLEQDDRGPSFVQKVGKRLAAMRGKVQGAYRLDGEFSSSSKTWLYFAMHVAAEAAEQKFQTELTAAEANVGMTLESAKTFHDAMDNGNHAKAVKVLEAAPARLEKKLAAEQREADAKSQAYNDYLADKARAGKAGAEREREWTHILHRQKRCVRWKPRKPLSPGRWGPVGAVGNFQAPQRVHVGSRPTVGPTITYGRNRKRLRAVANALWRTTSSISVESGMQSARPI